MLRVLAALGLMVLCCATSLSAQEKQKPLRWGADAEGGAPYIFKNPKNIEENIGFEVDLIQALEKELGRKIEFRQYNYNELEQGLERGDFDFAMNGLEITATRNKQLRMSRAYYRYTLQLVTLTDEMRFDTVDPLATLKQIKQLNLRVGTLNNTAAEKFLKKEGLDTKSYDGQAEPYEDLQLGRMAAVLLDLPIAESYARPKPALKFVGQSFGLGGYGIAFRKEDEELAQQFDAAILKLAQNGELEKIYRRWNIWNEEQTHLTEEARFGEGADAFSEGYNFTAYFPILCKSALVTIELSFLSMLLAVSIGLIVAIARLYGPWPLRWLALGYVEFFRGIPVLLLLYVLYYALPKLLAQYGIAWRPQDFTVGIIAFGLNYAAYEAEIYRAGIGAIPQGQWEAAASLGMNKVTTFWRIILPQTWRVVLPPMTNDFVALFKDTSVVSVIGVIELTKQYQIEAKSSLKYMEIGLATAVLYLIMSVPLGYLSRWMEKRLSKA